MPTEAEREDKIQQFAQLQGQIVAEALRANPPIVTLPEAVTQALLKLAAGAGGPPASPVFDPITQMQRDLQLQQQQAVAQGRQVQVNRFVGNGFEGRLTTVPQLLAEIADLLHGQTKLLEEIAGLLEKKKGR